MPSLLEVLIEEFEHGWNTANTAYAIAIGGFLLLAYVYSKVVLSGDP